MPSAKMMAALRGGAVLKPQQGPTASAVRWGTAPQDETEARHQEDQRALAENIKKQNPFGEFSIIDVDFFDGLQQEIEHKLGGPAKGAFPVQLVGNAGSLSVFMEPELHGGAPIDHNRAHTHVKLRATLACRAKVLVWR